MNYVPNRNIFFHIPVSLAPSSELDYKFKNCMLTDESGEDWPPILYVLAKKHKLPTLHTYGCVLDGTCEYKFLVELNLTLN